jgi:hypothetical protein
MDKDDDVVDNFLLPTAINASSAHDPTTIIATFLELDLTFAGVAAFPRESLSFSDSDATISVVLSVMLETGDDTGEIVVVGNVEFGGEVGIVELGVLVSRCIGILIDKLNERLTPNNPRTLL